MSFVPDMVTPEYAMIKTREDYSHIKDLKFPEDQRRIARLSLVEMQVWYAAQDPQALIDLGGGYDFQQFWFFRYILPLKLKRFLFSFKFW